MTFFFFVFFFLHISNNISQDITLPDFLCTLLWKLYCPFWHQARAFPFPHPLLYYYRYYYTCEPDSRNGWQKVTWLFILFTSTRKVIPSKLHMKLLTFWKPNSRVSSQCKYIYSNHLLPEQRVTSIRLETIVLFIQFSD